MSDHRSGLAILINGRIFWVAEPLTSSRYLALMVFVVARRTSDRPIQKDTTDIDKPIVHSRLECLGFLLLLSENRMNSIKTFFDLILKQCPNQGSATGPEFSWLYFPDPAL
ncbi:hypothetical protein OIU74_026029 [Salix koriyanagi]|uniref:Uncharacterized protein n=1 Tax=Salix koriyanagi TaxID=2511006 RepID=A0A9Q0W3E8_9ROSI|nr:hypothetical protein OIU74_026029 [Salix koriyanagi]